MENDDVISKKVAEIYAGRDWHRLSAEEQGLVKMLEEGGYIVPNDPEDGFVGGLAFSASPILMEFCHYMRNTNMVMVHIQPSDLMHPGYLVHKGASQENPRELELIETLVLGKNGRFVSRKRVFEALSRRYNRFDLLMFENCVADFLRIEKGIADGSISLGIPPIDL